MNPDEVHLRHVLLTLVADHDGAYGWYQLARYPVDYGAGPQPPAMWEVKKLVSQGLLTSVRDRGGDERYSITADGSASLAQLDLERGALPYLDPGVGKTPRDQR